jgi:DNA modification methylase
MPPTPQLGRNRPGAPAYEDGSVTVYLGDAREIMADLPAESIDCVITSPPYWGLRNFGVVSTVWGGNADCRHQWSAIQLRRRKDSVPAESSTCPGRVGITDGQTGARTRGGRSCQRCGAWLGSLGLEPSPEIFVAHLVDFFRDLKRVLKPTGTLWLNLGDSFHGGSSRRLARHTLKPKDLIGIPWRVALGLQADGWFLRSDIVWHKPNPVPEPAADRPVRAHEFLFLLTKEPQYFYDAEAVREPVVTRPSVRPTPAQSSGADKYQPLRDLPVEVAGGYLHREAPPARDRHRRSVWTIPTQPYRGSHTATFPIKLVEPCILAGTSAAGCCSKCGRPWRREIEVNYQPTGRRTEGGQRRHADRLVFEIAVQQVRHARTIGWRPTCDCQAPSVPAVVLDPFVGTGTTLAVAKQLGRRAVGVELNAGYFDLIKQRVSEIPEHSAESAIGESSDSKAAA